MKYTNIYTHLFFLLTFQPINSSKSAKEVDDKDPPTKQDIPRLITAKERDSLLDMIKGDKHDDIVSFFNTNNLIDYALIRFHSPTDDSINGYTPLAAAIRLCSKNAAKVLAPLQFAHPWTVTVAPLHSLPEIAAKHCPALLIEAAEKSKTDYPLAPMIRELEFTHLVGIINILTDTSSKMSADEKTKLSQWVDFIFNIKFQDQMNELLKEFLDQKDKDKKKTVQMYSDISLLIQKWVETGRDTKPLIEIFKKQGTNDLHSIAAIELIKSDRPQEFLYFFKELDTDIDTDKQLQLDTLRKASVHITVEQLKSFDDTFKQNLRDHFASLDLDKHFDYLQKSTDLLVTNSPFMYSVISGSEIDLLAGMLGGQGDLPALLSSAGGNMDESTKKIVKLQSGSTELDPKEAEAIVKAANKMIPHAYSHFIKRYPHIDTVIELTPLDKTQVIWIGNDGSIDIDPDFVGFTKNLVQAYTKDSPDELKDLLDNAKWGSKSPEELRFNFAPHKLSLSKAAIMLNKPKIFAYLMTRPNASLHLATKHQLTEMEMATCYQPQFLLDHILPVIAKSCKKRLRAANNLIAMFKETGFQRCPTGAKNAPKVLPRLITSKIEDEVSCIDFYKKDAIEEAFEHNFPTELIKALHSTGKYTNNEYYISLAAKHGDLKLFSYFVKGPSQAAEEALATWVRSSDGLLNDKNVNMLEFLLKHKDVKLNAVMKDSGASALSFAVQRSFVWIVKRLLLEKDLDVNITDTNTLTTPIQHSINVFRTVVFEKEGAHHWLVNYAYRVAKGLDLDVDLSYVQGKLKMVHGWLKKTKIEAAKKELGDFIPVLDRCAHYLGMNSYAVKLKDKTILEALPIVLEILNELVVKMPQVEAMLLTDNLLQVRIDTKYNYSAISVGYVKFAIFYCRDLLQQAFEKLGEIQSLDLNARTGGYSAASGLLHNVLLAHPAIDTTVENAASIDTLYITKKRALYLVGDEDGADEMARTHVRVRNIDTLYDGKRNYKRIAIGVVSTLIVGTVSAGIVRLMF